MILSIWSWDRPGRALGSAVFREPEMQSSRTRLAADSRVVRLSLVQPSKFVRAACLRLVSVSQLEEALRDHEAAMPFPLLEVGPLPGSIPSMFWKPTRSDCRLVECLMAKGKASGSWTRQEMAVTEGRAANEFVKRGSNLLCQLAVADAVGGGGPEDHQPELLERCEL